MRWSETIYKYFTTYKSNSLQFDVIPETANTLSPQVRRIAMVDGMFVGKSLKLVHSSTTNL